MSRIAVSIEIDASTERVWEIVEPVERHVDWMHDAVAIRFMTDQHRGVGTKFLCDTKVGPITLVDHMEITAWEPGATMGVRHTGLPHAVRMEGVQFHPESILTEHGHAMLKNFLQ